MSRIMYSFDQPHLKKGHHIIKDPHGTPTSLSKVPNLNLAGSTKLTLPNHYTTKLTQKIENNNRISN